MCIRDRRSSISKRDKFIEKMGMEKSFDKFIYEEVKNEVKTLKNHLKKYLILTWSYKTQKFIWL